MFSSATELDQTLVNWHGEDDHTNNIGELKAMLVAQNLQDAVSWHEAQHEARLSTSGTHLKIQ